MLLLNNWRHYLVILIITVILGYFLGITVSTVVDYRLKDAVINLPTPRNKIMVNLNDSAILETFKSKKTSKKTSKNKSKKTSKNKSHKKIGKSQIDKSKNKSDKKVLKKQKDKYKAKKETTDEEDHIEKFTSKINDSNLKNYSDKFMKSESKSDISLFKAANEEYGDQNYQKFV